MTERQQWSSLAAAVLNQAIKDRSKARESLLRNPSNKKAQWTVDETDVFFGSRWFEELLAMSGIDVDVEEIKRSIYGR